MLTPQPRRPDHVVVITDTHGFEKYCLTEAVKVRQLLVQIVDDKGVPLDANIGIRETYDSLPRNTCTNKIIPPPSGCEPTGEQGIARFLDTLTVAIPVCNTGIAASSECGFEVTATWYACSDGYSNAFWSSKRNTRAHLVTVDKNETFYAPGTKLR